MIDPHVHLRDWNQSNKETLRHGMMVAEKAGLDAVFEMPNTDPQLVDRSSIKRRIGEADRTGIPIFHGLYAGLTSSTDQVREMVQLHTELFPRVVGFKLFAGSSTGSLAVTEKADQGDIFSVLASLGYRGVVAVHCEKESLLNPSVWDPSDPRSHAMSRPAEAEIESVRDIITIAHRAGFEGTLHICHVSVPESIHLIEESRAEAGFLITCGITPHHALLNDSMMAEENGILLKVNPPLREIDKQSQMLKYLLEGRIDCIETDHAPHTLREKVGPPYASGIPGFPFYPVFLSLLKRMGISDELMFEITHSRIEEIFKISIPQISSLHQRYQSDEYEFDPYSGLIQSLNFPEVCPGSD